LGEHVGVLGWLEREIQGIGAQHGVLRGEYDGGNLHNFSWTKKTYNHFELNVLIKMTGTKPTWEKDIGESSPEERRLEWSSCFRNILFRSQFTRTIGILATSSPKDTMFKLGSME
jgi:hypothetical protein